ncbi:hypothetical protein ABPG77_005909, partial [Micractinium sp. CCAP 211/92]
ALFDLQLSSIKSLHPTQTSVDQHPRLHILAERYAHLTASVLLLHADFLDGPLDTNIDRLRYAVMNLLIHLSRQYSQKGRGTVFLIINFSFVAATLKEAHARGLPATPGTLSTGSETNSGLGNTGLALLKEFEDSLARCTTLYCDDQLNRVAPALVSFVKRGEAAAQGVPEGQPVPGFGPPEAAPVAAEFSQKWQHMVEAIHRRGRQGQGRRGWQGRARAWPARVAGSGQGMLPDLAGCCASAREALPVGSSTRRLPRLPFGQSDMRVSQICACCGPGAGSQTHACLPSAPQGGRQGLWGQRHGARRAAGRLHPAAAVLQPLPGAGQAAGAGWPVGGAAGCDAPVHNVRGAGRCGCVGGGGVGVGGVGGVGGGSAAAFLAGREGCLAGCGSGPPDGWAAAAPPGTATRLLLGSAYHAALSSHATLTKRGLRPACPRSMQVLYQALQWMRIGCRGF